MSFVPSLPASRGVRSKLDAVVFDLDGTLADTILDLATALNATLAELGLAPHAPDTVHGMVGGGLDMLLDRGIAAHGARIDAERRAWAGTRLLEIYALRPAEQSRLYPGVSEALAGLRAGGIAAGVCTNKPHAIATSLLESLGLAGSFGCIQGSETGLPKKPHPASLLRVLARLGARPERAVMVGDSAADVEAARAAGLRGIVLVGYGYSRRPVHELGADAVIESLADLPEALASIGEARRLTLK